MQARTRDIECCTTFRSLHACDHCFHVINPPYTQVNEWYEWYEIEHSDKEVKRRVFIATDEPKVLKELTASYV